MRVVVAPASFKGSLISLHACNVISRAIRLSHPSVSVRKLVLADGGEGTLETFVAHFGAQLRTGIASDPLGRPTRARWAVMGRSALVQSCETAGISLLKPEELDPLKASSHGVGQQILSAIRAGASTVFVSMGDSAVLDFGLGLMVALGARWLDHRGVEIAPSLESSHRIRDVDLIQTIQLLQSANIVVLFDTKDFFCGDAGQVELYAAQKGLEPSQTGPVEGIFREFARFVHDRWSVDLAGVAGSSGSGGAAGTMHALLGARLEHTLQFLDDRLQVGKQFSDAEIVITGEGRLDYQTRFGKVPMFVSDCLTGQDCFYFVGAVTPEGASAVSSSSPNFVPLNARLDCRSALTEAVAGIAYKLQGS